MLLLNNKQSHKYRPEMGVTNDEINWLEYAFKALVSIVGIGFTGWGSWMMSAIKKIGDKLDILEGEITDHTLEDARTYVSKVDFRDTMVETKESLKRINERMDDIFNAMNNNHRK